MNLTYKMTPREYYLGWKYRRQKHNKFEKYKFRLIIALFIIMMLIAMRINIYLFLFAFFMILFVIFLYAMQKKTVMRMYGESPVCNCEHTVSVSDEGIELINSFERKFIPWQSVYAVCETPEFLLILPGRSTSSEVISKQRYASAEYDAVASAIKAHVKVEEGRKI